MKKLVLASKSDYNNGKNSVKKLALTTLFLCFSTVSQAATVQCSFLSETKLNTQGQWLSTEMDLMKLMEMFGDGLKMKLEDTLLKKLDLKTPFYVGEVSRGKVYLKGGDMGIEGKLTNVQSGVITIYDGSCQVSFGG